MERKSVLACCLLCLVTLLAFVVSCSCARTSEKKEVIIYFGPIDKSTQIVAGREKALEVRVDNPRGRKLTFKWSSVKPGGKVFWVQDAHAATYHAPVTPGIDTVTVKVFADNSPVDSGSIEMQVVEEIEEPAETQRALIKPGANEVGSPFKAEEGGPLITSIEPRPETCSPMAECVVTVRGTWSGIRGKSLLLLIRPEPSRLDQSWWVQAKPALEKDGRWSVNPVFVGRPGDQAGVPFRVCVVVADAELSRGQSVGEPPSGPRHCIDVSRGKR